MTNFENHCQFYICNLANAFANSYNERLSLIANYNYNAMNL